MRRSLLGVALLLIVSGCGGAASFDRGPTQTQDRSITAVSAVELATSGNLSLRTGDPPSLRITAGANVLDDLTSDISGNRLTLDDKRAFGNVGTVRYELVLPEARELVLSGSGEIRVAGPSAVTDLTLSGSGELNVAGLTGDGLTADLSGSGRIVVAGEIAAQTVSLDGSGQYDARELTSRVAEVTIGGSGTADVHVTGTLEAVIEGSGTIRHTGGATVHTRIDGSGTVTEG